jgi:4-hydroxybenzoyl-CoA thioesterase
MIALPALLQNLPSFTLAGALSAGARVAGPNRFVSTRQIRFGHCDPAAIVFYPQYVLLFQEVQEDFFQYGLGVDYYAMVAGGLGAPIVRMDAVFQRPSRMGDVVDFVVSVKAIGNSSITTSFECFGADGLRVTAGLKFVMVDHTVRRTVPIPQELHTRLSHFQHRGAGVPEAEVSRGIGSES